ncbi:MAG: M67 family metallopeptidase [Anaerolineales bacterium]|nr:M67 family metallopeptidase [Anaerolineales bacterium]
MTAGCLEVSLENWQQMKAHVQSVDPREACGMVSGRGHVSEKVYEVKNVAAGEHRFRMEPSEQVRAFFDIERSGYDFLAIYHSHPDGPARPSRIDHEEWCYPHVLCLLWSRDAGEWICKVFAYSTEGFNEVSLCVPDNASDILSSDQAVAREQRTR